MLLEEILSCPEAERTITLIEISADNKSNSHKMTRPALRVIRDRANCCFPTGLGICEMGVYT